MSKSYEPQLPFAENEDLNRLFAEVVLNLPLEQTFTYEIPDDLLPEIKTGIRVLVPFRNRKVIGIITRTHRDSKIENLKKIIKIIDNQPLLDENLYNLARWISDYFLCPLGDSIRSVIPGGFSFVQPKTRLGYKIADVKNAEEFIANATARAKNQVDALQYLIKVNDYASANLIKNHTGVNPGTLRALEGKGLIRKAAVIERRSPFLTATVKSDKPQKPTAHQKKALDTLRKGLDSEKKDRTYLLYGITGSGKTEVYLQIISDVLARGRQVIVLVPEISLTPQTVGRFRSRFGEKIAVLHSALSPGERYDELRRVAGGEVEIAIGARSAVFAPFNNLGLIIIDEEHEPSYKQTEKPRYHARTVACERARREGAMVLLGSATPAVESYYLAETGEYTLLELPERVEKRNLPDVRLVDMRRKVAASKRHGLLSDELIIETKNALERKEQVIYFLNRRGFSTQVQCRLCGHIWTCNNCEVALTHHRQNNHLLCHYCAATFPVPDSCPDCRAPYVSFVGTGTEKIEKLVHEVFPAARIARMDADTTTAKGSHDLILSSFARHEKDILIGTQMIAKGLDILNVTLVGVINADLSLFWTDFRAHERTFQILTQVAGRAGRGHRPGNVLIQSFIPHNLAIAAAQTQDYPRFYKREIGSRQKLGYPPFRNIIHILMRGPEESDLKSRAAGFSKLILETIEKGKIEGVDLLGPSPAPMLRLKGMFRYQIIVLGTNLNETREVIREALKIWERQYGCKDFNISVDVDPQSLI